MVARQNLTVYQGADFRRALEFRDEAGSIMDLTGYSFRAQGRTSYAANSASFSFVFTVRNQVSDKGFVDMHLPAASTAALSLNKEQDYFYDLEMVLPSGDVRRVMEGKVKVYPEVTR